MKKRKLWLLLGGIVLVLVLALTPLMAGCAAPAEEVKPPVEKPPVEKPPEKVFELVYSSHEVETNTIYLSVNYVMDLIEERTNGRVLFTDRYHSGQLFSAFEILNGLSLGGCDLGGLYSAYFPGELDLRSGLGIPLSIDDLGQYLKAETEMVRTDSRLIEEATGNNIHYLACDAGAFFHVFTREPIAKYEDLAGLTLWSFGPLAQIVEAWGGTPLMLSLPELYEGLQKGLIDGGTNVISTQHETKLYEVSKYFTEVGLGPWDAGYTSAINLDTWNSLPPDIQKIFEDSIDEGIPYMFELQRRDDERRVKDFLEAGVILSTFPPEEIAKVKALVSVPTDAWVNLKPEDAAARRQLVQDFLDIVARTTVPAGWAWDPRSLFK